MKKYLIYLGAAILSAAVVSSCKSKDDTENQVTGVTIDPPMLNLTVNDSGELTATVAPASANQEVEWSWESYPVGNTELLELTPGAESKVIVKAKAPGKAIVIATSKSGGKTATCIVKIAQGEVPVTGVSLDKDDYTFTGADGTITLTATIAPQDATNKALTWRVEDVIGTGVIALSAGANDYTKTVTPLSFGKAKVVVTTSDGGLEDECVITVSPVSVSGVSLNKNSHTFSNLGETVELVATIAPSNATNKALTWSVENVSGTGVVELLAGANDYTKTVKALSPGKAKVIVTTSDGGLKDECEITVSASDVNLTSSLSNPGPTFSYGAEIANGCFFHVVGWEKAGCNTLNADVCTWSADGKLGMGFQALSYHVPAWGWDPLLTNAKLYQTITTLNPGTYRFDVYVSKFLAANISGYVVANAGSALPDLAQVETEALGFAAINGEAKFSAAFTVTASGPVSLGFVVYLDDGHFRFSKVELWQTF